MNWLEALKQFNKGRDKWLIPKKDTPEYAQVRALMRDTEEVMEGGELSVLPNFFSKWLADYGDSGIHAIYVSRAPVLKVYQDLLNIFTRNGVKNKIKELKFDNLFHTFLLYHMKKDNSMWLVERNARFNVMKYDRYNPHPEFSGGMKTLNITTPKTVSEMFNNHQKSIGGWNKVIFYDPVNNNCQKFVSNHLKANGLMTSTLDRFVNQDIQKILNYYPITRQFVKHVIALGLIIENIFNF